VCKEFLHPSQDSEAGLSLIQVRLLVVNYSKGFLTVHRRWKCFQFRQKLVTKLGKSRLIIFFCKCLQSLFLWLEFLLQSLVFLLCLVVLALDLLVDRVVPGDRQQTQLELLLGTEVFDDVLQQVLRFLHFI